MGSSHRTADGRHLKEQSVQNKTALRQSNNVMGQEHFWNSSVASKWRIAAEAKRPTWAEFWRHTYWLEKQNNRAHQKGDVKYWKNTKQKLYEEDSFRCTGFYGAFQYTLLCKGEFSVVIMATSGMKFGIPIGVSPFQISTKRFAGNVVRVNAFASNADERNFRTHTRLHW